MTKIDEFQEHLEKFGYQKINVENVKIKEKIINVLKYSKNGIAPSKMDMNIIYGAIQDCDHHDLCRVDQILARIKNAAEPENEFEWGSIILNCKWKKI